MSSRDFSRDETETARRRMKHLAPWRIEPVPAVHVAARDRLAPAPMSGAARERCKRIALNVLAIQIAAAGSGSPLPDLS